MNQMVPVKNLSELHWYSGCFMRGIGEGGDEDFPAEIR